MILLPSQGIAVKPRAVTAHHIELDVFSDWIEACVLLEEVDVSRTDVLDVLLGENLYESQDFAREIVDSAWLEIERRSSLCPSTYGVFVDGEWVRASGNWTDRTAHAFCLILSLATSYDWWYKHFGSNYQNQGRLFETLTDRSLSTLSPGWTVFPTGWSGTNTQQALKLAQQVADRINCGTAFAPQWDTSKAKDLSLDILLYLPFADQRQGCPYFLVQCASGGNWVQKLKEPDVDQWRYLLNPQTLPVRGIAVPFCLLDGEFSKSCTVSSGLFLDRCRLLSAGEKTANWLPGDVQTEMRDWATPRIKEILERSL